MKSEQPDGERTKLVADALQAKNRETRYRRIEAVVIGAVLLLAVIFGPIAYTATQRQQDIRDLGQQNVCITRITARAIGAFGEALAAPPAPNTSREAAVTKIQKAAKMLRQIDKECPAP